MIAQQDVRESGCQRLIYNSGDMSTNKVKSELCMNYKYQNMHFDLLQQM